MPAASSNGAWTQRDSFVAAEMALVIALRGTGILESLAPPVDRLRALEELMSTRTVSSEDQIATTHCSTPLALSWLVAQIAQIGSDDTVLKPSAGVRIIARWAGQGRALHLNEINPIRVELLRLLFPNAHVTNVEAAHVDQFGLQPIVILMNPPFAHDALGKEPPKSAITCAGPSGSASDEKA